MAKLSILTLPADPETGRYPFVFVLSDLDQPLGDVDQLSAQLSSSAMKQKGAVGFLTFTYPVEVD